MIRSRCIPRPETRRGFTMVELLVTISIIAILAGIVLRALSATRETAKIAKTKATIAKIDRLIMRQYNSYQTRRVPLPTSPSEEVIEYLDINDDGKLTEPAEIAGLRYMALYDMMRLEMPDRETDLSEGPVTNPINPVILDARPAASMAYLQDWISHGQDLDWLPAECLYKIISRGSATGLEDFKETEIGDIDNDGWPEFHDAWGQPIMFLRWPARFLPPNSEVQTGDVVNDHDPFDHMKQSGVAYRLVPLIYSAGPDREYGISVGAFVFDSSPFRSMSGNTNDAGSVVGGEEHQDNIHNHRIEGR